jgi:hypothetical protein
MAAPKNNKNAVGNKGGARPDYATRKKISTFKGMVLNYVIGIMKKGAKEEKNALVYRCISAVLPRPIELQGEFEGKLTLDFIKNAPNNELARIIKEGINTGSSKRVSKKGTGKTEAK